MDFTDGDYCKSSRTLLMFLGQWPYQKLVDRKIRSTFSAIVILLVQILQFAKLIRSFRDLDMFECVPPMITTAVCFTKILVLILSRKKLEKLLNQMNDDWRGRTDSEEIEIMKSYMNQGKVYVTVYTYFMYLTLTAYILFIFEPCVLDIVSPLNETRPLKLLYPAEFFIDEEKYFVWITFIGILTCIFGITVLIANDTMLIIYIQYICGMLAIVGHRLEFTLYKLSNANRDSSNRNRKMYDLYIGQCVRMHRKALNFVGLLESSFMISQLVQLGLNVICLSVTLVRVVALLGSLEILRYVLYAIGQLLHLLYVSYQSEKLINHSLNISKRIYSGTWYNIPKETQKMLLFLLQRSNIPSYLTAGKIFIFSMENFSMVVQNSMSYFMVLASLE